MEKKQKMILKVENVNHRSSGMFFLQDLVFLILEIENCLAK